MKNYLLVLISVLCLTSISIAQKKQFVSESHLITKANGKSTNVSINKIVYLELTLWGTAKYNDIGKVWITNAHLRNDYKSITKMQEFRVFKVDLLDNGIYNYWCVDLGSDGQTVLFKLDQNGARETVTMKRYAPGNSNNVLKTIKYYID